MTKDEDFAKGKKKKRNFFCYFIFYLYLCTRNQIKQRMDTLNKLMSIEQQVIDIGKKMQLEAKVCGAELEERLRLGLEGKAAIEHYNAWMKRYHMEHLIVEE